MRTLLIALGLLLATAAMAVENQAFLGIFAETKLMKMAGMPDMSAMMTNMPAAAMANMPDMPGMPSRALTVRLWSPGIAAKTAAASLAVPAGLKQGAVLNLELYRPQAERVTPGTTDISKIPDFTIKRYWGSSATVKPGQPEVIRFDALTPEQQAVMRAQAEKAQRKDSYFYKPDWTTGYWPTGRQPGKIAKDAAMPGRYALTTNYTGNVAIDVPAEVDFLAPIDMAAPKFDKAIPLEKAITFTWNPVPNILGYHAMIMGMQGEKMLILWDSSEIRTGFGVDWDYMQMSDVRAMVKTTEMMAPTCVTMTVPAGIFKDCDFVQLIMIGYGPGAALGEGQPIPRVQTKTTFTATLGGKKMKDMMGGMDDMGDDN